MDPKPLQKYQNGHKKYDKKNLKKTFLVLGVTHMCELIKDFS